ncbi:MAG: LPS export ABC transporter permease LptF [Alphaproteobacteria bacterium]|jgi:lipopolysaccharide export system permease protein|nr:LPS export ABC transporter permease LptF [Alphaproteobacteria bacterium]
MTSIGSYIFRQLALATLFVVAVLTLLVSLFGTLRLIDFIVNRGLPISVLLELSFLNLPKFIAILLPIAVFAAVLVVYNKLRNDSELVVMRAAGMSQGSLARPGLTLGIIAVLIGYMLQLYLVPATIHTFKLKQIDYRNSYGSVLLQEQRFNSPINGLTIYIRERSSEGELRGIFAHDSRVPERPVTYLAERATAAQSTDGTSLVLFNGSQQDFNRASGRLTVFNFDQYSLDLNIFNESAKPRWREPEERYLDSLLNPGTSAHDVYYNTQLIAEGHRRLSNPLYILVFAVVGMAAMLAGNFSRRGNTIRILVAIATIFVLQVISISLFNVTRQTLALIPFLYALPIFAILVGLTVIIQSRFHRPSGLILSDG